MKRRGFTVIEVVIVSVFLITAGIILALQLKSIRSEQENSHRKTAINAIYYSLEESFYPANKYYPERITDGTLSAIDQALLTDPNGNKIGSPKSDYRYEGKDCKDNQCQGYTLRATLDNEEDFIKKNRN